ncbi:hypothetical protein P692DRAFT_20561747 [Suillus brevipes Sb2]|nr:hypothetical protein P692DRAFT_20561747 [Suillus brevipes Sb2]
MSNSIAESLLHFFCIVSFTLWTSAWRPCVCWHGSNILLVIIDAHRATPLELKFIFRAILLRRSSLENRLSALGACTGMHMTSCSLVTTRERSTQDPPGHRNQASTCVLLLQAHLIPS